MHIALLGTGLMGRAMVARLLDFNHSLIVYNRTREKATPLQELGAVVANTPEHAVQKAEAVILMLKDASAISQVLFPDEGPDPVLTGKTVIQMGTILPDESIDLQRSVERCGGEYLEAPVLGSMAEVDQGNLSVMVGAREEQFQNWISLLHCFSPEPKYIGAVGQAAALKLALNQLIASQTVAFSYSLGIVLKRGVDLEMFMGILKGSSLFAPQFEKKLPRMLDRDFSNPNFSTKNLFKDVELTLAEGRNLGLETVAFKGVRNLVQKALDQGWTETDYSSLYNAVVPEGISKNSS